MNNANETETYQIDEAFEQHGKLCFFNDTSPRLNLTYFIQRKLKLKPYMVIIIEFPLK